MVFWWTKWLWLTEFFIQNWIFLVIAKPHCKWQFSGDRNKPPLHTQDLWEILHLSWLVKPIQKSYFSKFEGHADNKIASQKATIKIQTIALSSREICHVGEAEGQNLQHHLECSFESRVDECSLAGYGWSFLAKFNHENQCTFNENHSYSRVIFIHIQHQI